MYVRRYEPAFISSFFVNKIKQVATGLPVKRLLILVFFVRVIFMSVVKKQQNNQTPN